MGKNTSRDDRRNNMIGLGIIGVLGVCIDILI